MLSPTLLWLLVGLALCSAELLLPTAFVAFVMGISALIVALVALVLPVVGLQVLIWMMLSLGFVWLTRRFLPPRKRSNSMDAVEARTLTEILPGEGGRVLYEGNSWQARCEDRQVTIPAGQQVYVVGRLGTTLMVVPQKLIEDELRS